MYFTNNQESPTMYLRESPATQFPTINPSGFLKRNYNCASKYIFMRRGYITYTHSYSLFRVSVVNRSKPEIHMVGNCSCAAAKRSFQTWSICQAVPTSTPSAADCFSVYIMKSESKYKLAWQIIASKRSPRKHTTSAKKIPDNTLHDIYAIYYCC